MLLFEFRAQAQARAEARQREKLSNNPVQMDNFMARKYIGLMSKGNRRIMQGRCVTHKLIESHLVSGEMIPGKEIGLKIDQTLTQDATGTMVMLELEAMGVEKAKTEISAQYVDHNLLQTDYK